MPIIDPVTYCPVVPTAEASLEIRLPFGLPSIQATAALDASIQTRCKSLELVFGQINASLAAILPIIQLAGCLVKIMKALEAAKDIVSDPTKLTDALTDLQDCAALFINFSFNPNPVPICRLILDLLSACIKLLKCILALLTITVDTDTEIANLNGTLDVQLIAQAGCLTTENNALKLGLAKKLDTLQVLLLVMNAIIGAVPPLMAAMGGAYPLDANSLSLNVSSINSAITKLDLARDAVVTCAAAAKIPLADL